MKKRKNFFFIPDPETTEVNNIKLIYVFNFICLTVSDNYNDNNGEDSVHEFARIFGTEHPWFWRIHITALVTLGKI